MNLAFNVEMMLFNRSLTVRRSAVGVPQTPGKLTRLPPIVILVLYLSFLPSRNTHTILAYILSPFLSLGNSVLLMKKMVFVTVARHLISFPNDLLHVSLYLGCLMRWRYSNRSPVSSSRTAYAKSHRNCNGYWRDAAWRAVKGAVYLFISIMWSV